MNASLLKMYKLMSYIQHMYAIHKEKDINNLLTIWMIYYMDVTLQYLCCL